MWNYKRVYMHIIADDIGNAFQDALVCLPEDSKVYNMTITKDYDQSSFLEGKSIIPIQKEIFTEVEKQAYEDFFNKNI